jgi:hypothetical protein
MSADSHFIVFSATVRKVLEDRWQEDLHMPLSDLFFSHSILSLKHHTHRLTGTYAKAEGGQLNADLAGQYVTL